MSSSGWVKGSLNMFQFSNQRYIFYSTLSEILMRSFDQMGTPEPSGISAAVSALLFSLLAVVLHVAYNLKL